MKAVNLVLAGPASGGNAAPTFRSLVAADMPAFTGGDITTSAGSTNATIATGAVSNGKLATAPTLTIKGNITGGTAIVSDLAPTAVLDAAFGSAQGSILVRGASAWTVLMPGTLGQVLTSGGSSANNAWTTPSPFYPITGTSAKSSAYTLGSTGGDTGKIFLLTGSFALTVPLASGGSTAAPLYFHYSKRDGSGSCTLVLSGSDTWEDGTTAAKFIYQETGTIESTGSGIWRFAPGTRQRGWVDAGAYAVTSGSVNNTITVGTGDADLRDMEINNYNYVPSTSGELDLSLKQSGSLSTLSGDFFNGGTKSAISGTSAPITQSSVAATYFRIILRNINSAAANSIWVDYIAGFGANLYNGIFFASTTGALSSLIFTPSAGTITSMYYTVRVFRP